MRDEHIKSLVVKIGLTLLIAILPLPLPFPKATKYQAAFNGFLIDEIWGIRHSLEEWDGLATQSGMREL